MGSKESKNKAVAPKETVQPPATSQIGEKENTQTPLPLVSTDTKPVRQTPEPAPVPTLTAPISTEKKEEIAWSTPKLPSKADFPPAKPVPTPAVSNPPITADPKPGSAFAKDFFLPPIHRKPVLNPVSPLEESLESFELVTEMPARKGPKDLDDRFNGRSNSNTLLANRMQFIPTLPDFLDSEELDHDALVLSQSFTRPLPGKLDLTIPSEGSQISALQGIDSIGVDYLEQGSDLSVSPPRLVSKKFNMLNSRLAL